MKVVGVSPPIVRIPTPEDAVRVGEAPASAWEEGYSGLFAADALAELAQARRIMWSHIFADPSFDFESIVVAEEAGEVVGYSHFGSSSRERDRGRGLWVLCPSAGLGHRGFDGNDGGHSCAAEVSAR
jgi:hypothetical protein